MGKSLKTYVLLSAKNWHDTLFYNLSTNPNENWVRIKEKDDFVIEKLKLLNPDKVFIPHWSYIIPETIWSAFPCIVFHMTDLPYGRGGSPLQNLILSGKTDTKISALKVDNGIDTGDVFLKKDLFN